MERSIITIDEYGTVAIPSDIAMIWMSEMELVGLFGEIAPTLQAAIKSIYRSGTLKEYREQKCIRLENGYSTDVYSLPMIVSLAFRLNTYGAEQVRNILLERMCSRKEKTSIFFSLNTNNIKTSGLHS